MLILFLRNSIYLLLARSNSLPQTTNKIHVHTWDFLLFVWLILFSTNIIWSCIFLLAFFPLSLPPLSLSSLSFHSFSRFYQLHNTRREIFSIGRLCPLVKIAALRWMETHRWTIVDVQFGSCARIYAKMLFPTENKLYSIIKREMKRYINKVSNRKICNSKHSALLQLLSFQYSSYILVCIFCFLSTIPLYLEKYHKLPRTLECPSCGILFMSYGDTIV